MQHVIAGSKDKSVNRNRLLQNHQRKFLFRYTTCGGGPLYLGKPLAGELSIIITTKEETTGYGVKPSNCKLLNF